MKPECLECFGYPSTEKVWGEETPQYQALDQNIEEKFGVDPYQEVIGLCDAFSHRPLKGKCEFKVRQRLYQKVGESDPGFTGKTVLKEGMSVRDLVYQSYMFSSKSESPSQVCANNPQLERRLQEITGIEYPGLCQEYLLSIRDRVLESS